MPTSFPTARGAAAASVLALADAGDWEAAAEAALGVAAESGPLVAGAAWPSAMVLYLHGEWVAAEAVLGRADEGGPDDAADAALLAAWAASIAWVRGRAAECRQAAARALELARAAAVPRALAAAHTASALVAAAEGDREGNDRHHALALDAAERAGDRTQQVRIRANQASELLAEGDLDGAGAELEAALAVVDQPGPAVHPTIAGLTRHNRADLDLRGGRLLAARDGYRAACATLQRTGAASTAYALTGLGESHELRGDLQQARAAYEEAVFVAEHRDIAPALGPALCGLARVLAAIAGPNPGATGERPGPTAQQAGAAGEQGAAAQRVGAAAEGGAAAQRAGAAGEQVGTTAGRAVGMAERAVAMADGLTGAAAYAALGWAVLGTDPAAARGNAETALALARTNQVPAALADALELAAAAGPPDAADRLLADAAGVYADLGDRVGAARVALARARTGAGRAPAAERVLAEHRLRALAVDPDVGTRSLARAADRTAVRVRMLGSFAVLRGTDEVAAAAWQSRKARDLLKLLIARRGRPITRDALGEALWPGEENVANRLSIALSLLRAVLDPERGAPPGHYIRATGAGIAYDPRTLRTDVDDFLQLAAAGLAEPGPDARLLLAAAEAAYTGQVLDDEPDLAAALPLREEARGAYLAVVRALAAACTLAGDVDGALRTWLRVLEHDPYDEESALRLIEVLTAAGRHGEAARQHRRYAANMREIGVDPRPRGRS